MSEEKTLVEESLMLLAAQFRFSSFAIVEDFLEPVPVIVYSL
jgi:hypothetical protein